MNILLLGSGGREHAFAWKFSKSPLLKNLFIAPGNAGTATCGTNVQLNIKDFSLVKSFVLENKIDMVITDLNMPNMNGLEMTRAIRADQRYDGVPIVLLTTEGQKEKMIEGKKAGAAGWIVKPFDEEKICGVVAKMIG